MSKWKALLGGRRRDIDMTEGSVVRHLLAFAFPLLLGSLFQQLYNMVDTWVVGNYVSNEAFAAVGSVSPIISTLINFFTGLAGGAGVVISQYYGAHRHDKVHEAVHTFVCATLLMSVVFTFAGIALTPTLLGLMGTDPIVIPDATTYLTIYFAGVSGLLIYNMGSGILRAVGDSQNPFRFLVVSALLNITLDLLFVLGLGMGVAGVAYATILSQFISAALVILVLLRSNSCIQLIPRGIRIYSEMIRKIFRVGLPAAIQMSFTAFSNVFVQSYIYQFGADCMSGWAAYNKIDMLIYLPMISLSAANNTFVGQNLGNRNPERAREGVRTAQLLTFVTIVSLAAVTILFAPSFVAFFNDKPEVVEFGSFFVRVMSSTYFLYGINVIFTSALRGSGNSRTPMIILLTSFVFFRQFYMFIVSNFISNTLLALTLGYPAGWLVAALLSWGYYKKVGIHRSTIIEDTEPAK